MNYDDTEAVLALKARHEARGDYPALANLMQEWAEALRDPTAAADACVAAGDAAILGTDDRQRARALYERALERSPGHELALARLKTCAQALAGSDRAQRYDDTQRIWREQ